jgi:RNA polymerase sigma-70 factor, ECF subfamily
VQTKISAARIPYLVPEPDQLTERLDAVLAVIYLIFNEGYATSGSQYLRRELCDEAIRLATLVAEQLPEEMETHGLLLLMQFHRARFATRIDDEGVPVSLEDQDRTQWDRAAISGAAVQLETVLERRRPGPYQLQAAIAALHCEATRFSETDWPQIAALYLKLAEQTGNLVHNLNHLVAQSFAGDVQAALAELEALAPQLDAYQPFHAARAELALRAGHNYVAQEAYQRALEQSGSDAERAFLDRRRQMLGRGRCSEIIIRPVSLRCDP